MDKYVGKRLDGRYEIKEIIGVGGMAVVYKAYDCIDDRIVALKILKEEFVANEEFLRRFKNESKAIAVLSHPNIVKVYDVSFGDLLQYIVMEYIDGITLKEYIERQGSLRWKDAVHFISQILKALQHAHDKGIVHRDVKPQNIMLLPDGTIKVTDFGIARFARSEHRTMTDKAIGSVHYISPEQARGDITDEKSDIYSVGVMLYEMLTGTLPFQADSAVSVAIMQLQSAPKMPREINPAIPEGLEQITMRAMEKEPSKRYRSAAEMLRDIEELKRNPEMVFGYTFFVDDSPTRGTAIAGERLENYADDDIVSSSDDDYYEEDEEPEEKKTNIVPVLAGIAVALVVLLSVAGFFVFRWFSNQDNNMIEVPSLVGMKVDEIKQKQKDKVDGFDQFVFSFTPETDNDHDEYTIIRQSREAGTKVKTANNTIECFYSTGRKIVKVPDVYDTELITAKTNLGVLKFKTKVSYEASDEIESGRVIRTDPPKGTSAPEESEIEIIVSSGAPEVPVDIPSVTGLSIEEARKKIEDEGLKCEVGAAEDSATMPVAGKIARQDPTPGTGKGKKGQTVTIYPSTGKKTYKQTFSVNLPTDYYSAGKAEIVVKLGGITIDTVSDFDITKQSKIDIPVSFTPESIDDTKRIVYVILRGTDDDKLKNNSAVSSQMMDFYVKIECDFATGSTKTVGESSGYYVSKNFYDELYPGSSSSSRSSSQSSSSGSSSDSSSTSSGSSSASSSH